MLGVARIAGIMGAKRTSELVPLCHPLPLTKVGIEFTRTPAGQHPLHRHRQDPRPDRASRWRPHCAPCRSRC